MYDSDLFKSRKCIHIKLKKDVHRALRTKLFERNLSMQEVIDELARLISEGDKRLEKILDEYVVKKANREMAKLNGVKREVEKLNELDQDTLYDIIQSGNQ